MSKIGKRYKIEASLNEEEELRVNNYCESKHVSRYTLIRRAIFSYIQGSNSKLSDFPEGDPGKEPEDKGEENDKNGKRKGN